MQARALADPKLTIRWHSTIVGVLDGSSVEALLVRDTITGTESTLPVTRVFEAIGPPELVTGQVALDPVGERDAAGRGPRVTWGIRPAPGDGTFDSVWSA